MNIVHVSHDFEYETKSICLTAWILYPDKKNSGSNSWVEGTKPKSIQNYATLRGGEPKLFSSAGMEVKMLPARNKTHNGLG